MPLGQSFPMADFQRVSWKSVCRKCGTCLPKQGLLSSFPSPGPVEEDTQLPVKTGAWISFKLYTDHQSMADERWITHRCSSPVWLSGSQGWFIITWMIRQCQINIRFCYDTLSYVITATEKLKRQSTNASTKSGPASDASSGNGLTL
eukprot:2621601-Rhodomonas_salina.2